MGPMNRASLIKKAIKGYYKLLKDLEGIFVGHSHFEVSNYYSLLYG